jgi:hypothetical protein
MKDLSEHGWPPSVEARILAARAKQPAEVNVRAQVARRCLHPGGRCSLLDEMGLMIAGWGRWTLAFLAAVMLLLAGWLWTSSHVEGLSTVDSDAVVAFIQEGDWGDYL